MSLLIPPRPYWAGKNSPEGKVWCIEGQQKSLYGWHVPFGHDLHKAHLFAFRQRKDGVRYCKLLRDFWCTKKHWPDRVIDGINTMPVISRSKGMLKYADVPRLNLLHMDSAALATTLSRHYIDLSIVEMLVDDRLKTVEWVREEEPTLEWKEELENIWVR